MRTFFTSTSVSVLAVVVVLTSIIMASTKSSMFVLSQGYPTIPMKADLRLHPFTQIPVPNFDIVDGATVRIDTNYVQGADKLFFDYQGDFHIYNTFDAKAGVLYLAGTAPITEYLDAISTVVFYTTADDFQARRITWSLGKGTFYNVLTRHFYRFVPGTSPDSGTGIGWFSARYNCKAEKLLGMQGYLATITSYEEQALISAKTNMSLWIGLYAANKSNEWKWTDGPEANQLQYTGFSMYEGGLPAPGRAENAYAPWARFQPEDPSVESTGANFVAAIPSPYEPVAWWWNQAETDGVQGYVCEYGGLDDDSIASQMSKWTGTVVLEYSCMNFTLPGDCLNHASFGCLWNGKSCQQTSCRTYVTEKDCDSDFRCEWQTDLSVTQVGRCAATRCAGYSNADTCDADVSCTTSWQFGTSKCLDAKCSDKIQSCHCAQIDGCVWHDAVCDNSMTLGCDNFDVVFMFDGTQAMDQNFLTFSGGYQGLTDLFQKADWSTTRTPHSTTPHPTLTGQRVGFIRFGDTASFTPEGVGSWGMITGDYVEISTDLAYFQKGWVPATTRNIRQSLARAETMFASPDTVNRNKVLVIITAGPIDDAAGPETQQSLTNLRAAGVTVLTVTVRPTQPETSTSIAARDSLTAISPVTHILNVELDIILNTVIYGVCDVSSTLGQLVVQTSSAFECKNMPNATECNKFAVCGWSYSSDSCEQSHCLQYCDPTCGGDPTCTWDAAGSFCKEKCPGSSQGQCNGFADMCWWDTNALSCKTIACMNNPSEDACIADPYGCTYNASSPILCKPIMCKTTNMSLCEGDWQASCSSFEGQCFFDPCKIVNTDSHLCRQNPSCEWGGGKAGCITSPCGKYRTERHCNFDFDCAWDITVSPPACTPAVCTGYNKEPTTAPQMCAGMPEKCRYLPATSDSAARCELLVCGMMTRSCDCAKLPQCVWRNDQCKVSTFVQCPAIDVVFLIEGSPVMNRPFGRHPNGFIGIAETIRSWSREAPMTEDPAGTGFRLGMVLYGAANNAQIVPDDVGNGNNLTGSLNKWAGVGQVIDTMEEKQVVYSDSTGDNSAIWQGLEQAYNIFAPNKNDGRIKLLVVLGHSPITDGGRLESGNPVVRQNIQRLEAMGVRILANVIRRFSVITPIDVESRTFMEPLASDPASTFFSFTTIDDMRKNLLDKFCDPSTNTGKLLKISRDRTLPCSWLVGARECNMQGTCHWDQDAVPTCPEAGQCANMGCVTLPQTLVKAKFNCSHCQYKNGAFVCSRANLYPAKRGMCLQTPCMSHCDTATCNNDNSCTYKAPNSRCERKWCNQYTTWQDCNGDSGCVWDEFDNSGNIQLPGRCVQGNCWANRAAQSCGDQVAIDSSGVRSNCIWDTRFTPAICQQRRCDSMDQKTCGEDEVRCTYDLGAAGRKCSHIECAYGNGEECEIDPLCYWDPFQVKCMKRTQDCRISDFSRWTPCTSTCGNAIRYRVRKIVQFPDAALGASCEVVLNALKAPDGSALNASEKVMLQTQLCANVFPSWESDCSVYCTAKTSLVDCLNDIACQWSNGRCEKKLQTGCEIKPDKATCDKSDSCTWDEDYKFCLPDVTVCQFDKVGQCKGVDTCSWRKGPNSVSYGSHYGIQDVSLFNPGQKPMFVFPLLQFEQEEAQTTYINGAMVMIEQGYALGKDKLDLKLPVAVDIKWDPSRGALLLSGNNSVAEYGYAIHFITFETTSASSAPRLITWSLMPGTVYSGITKHHYARYDQAGISWNEAQIRCAMTNIFGQQGYLATVSSEEENTIIATKLGGDGWLGADDKRAGTWSWVTGPEAGETFWLGGCATCGGTVQPGLFANWDPIRRDPVPPINPQENNVYLNLSGFWHSRFNDYPESVGYVCEYGGLRTDSRPKFPTGGSTVFGPGGCMATPCVWHADVSNCIADPDCQWANGQCSTGCNSRSTVSDCISSERCYWNSQILPPVCAENPCIILGKSSCPTKPRCTWSVPQGKCVLKTGCLAEEARVGCEAIPTCIWYDTDGCVDRPCNSLTQQGDCMTNSKCKWVQGNCIDAVCQHSDSASCGADRKCEWNEPDAISMGFVPGQGSVHPFADSDTFMPADDSTIIDGITIAISSGFQSGDDILFLDPLPLTMSTFKPTWNARTGTLVLRTFSSAKLTPLTGFQMLQQYVSFSSTSSRRSTRQISYVLSANAVFSPQSKSFFKYVPTKVAVSTRAEAESYCSNINFFGASGTLAQPIKETDNLLLRSIKAQGWMGARATGGNWQWNESTLVTNTVNGTTTSTITFNMVTFWNYANGYGSPVATTDPNSFSRFRFASWGPSQPAAPADATQLQSGFISQDGSWMSVADGQQNLLPGVICQFGSAAEPLQVIVSAEAGVTPVGCFPRRCVNLLESQCKEDPQCLWRGSTCVVDDWCSVDVPVPLTVNQCKQRAGCYWDYKNIICLAAPATTCDPIEQAECNSNANPGCEWNSKLLPQPGTTAATTSGACVSAGCAVHPTQETCLASPICRWYMPSSVYGAGVCIERLCGYTSIDSCYQDKKCQWNATQSKCVPSVCLGSPNCNAMPECTPSTTVPGLCEYARCSSALPVGNPDGRAKCLSDPSCLVIDGACTKPDCDKYFTENACNDDNRCFFFIQRRPGGVLASRCDAAQCTMEEDAKSCGGSQPSDPCRWTGTSCRQASPSEQVPTELCVKETDPDMWWMYVLIPAILLLLGLIIWRLWIAYDRGISFLEPPRKTKRFDLSMYAADMFEDAQDRDNHGDYFNEDEL